jgi:hypothetical protein
LELVNQQFDPVKEEKNPLRRTARSQRNCWKRESGITGDQAASDAAERRGAALPWDALVAQAPTVADARDVRLLECAATERQRSSATHKMAAALWMGWEEK